MTGASFSLPPWASHERMHLPHHNMYARALSSLLHHSHHPLFYHVGVMQSLSDQWRRYSILKEGASLVLSWKVMLGLPEALQLPSFI